VGAAPRRELTAAVLGSVGAGASALVAGGQAWARVTAQREAPLPPVTGVLTGADAAPLMPAAGLVLLAAAVALVAVRGLGRALVGLLMAAAGGVLAWSGARALTGTLDDAAAQALPGRTPVAAEVSAAWPVLAVLAGLLGVAAGLLAVLRGGTWPAMGRRYERSRAEPIGAASPEPAAVRRPETDEDRAQAAWNALDRGEDPTDPARSGDGP
jgi:uncharacterized membrane protein (TIGR02234 family)